MSWVTAGLKALRVSQPFNAAATTTTRALLDMAGWRPEWIVRHLHRVGGVGDVLPNGRRLRLWSRGDDWVSNQVFWRGWRGYEPETAPLFFDLASRARLTLDVGAYVGYYSLLAGHANPLGRVIAFEPHAVVYERLGANVRLNRLEHVETVNAAVAAAPGRAPFYAVPDGLPTSSSLSRDFMSSCGAARALEAPIVALDEFLASRGVTGIDLMKIDTESTEPDVLRGAAEVLRRDRPIMVCEVLADRGAEAALEEILRPLAYRFYLLTPEGPQPQMRISGHPRWLNFLFVPEERVNSEGLGG